MATVDVNPVLPITNADWANRLSQSMRASVVVTQHNYWFKLKTKTLTWSDLFDKDNIAVAICEGARDYVKSLPLTPQERDRALNKVFKIKFGRDLRPLLQELLRDNEFPVNRCPGWLPLADRVKVNLTTLEFQPILARDHFLGCSPISSSQLLTLQANWAQVNPATKLTQDWLRIDTYMRNRAFDIEGRVDPVLFDYHIRLTIYLLSGYNHWNIVYNLFSNQGSTNGKTTYINTLAAILGDMAEPIPDYDLRNDARQTRPHWLKTRLVFQDSTSKTSLRRGFISNQLKAKLICVSDKRLTYTVAVRPQPYIAPEIRSDCPKYTYITPAIDYLPPRPTDFRSTESICFRQWASSDGAATFLYYLLIQARNQAEQGWDLSGPEGPLPNSVY